MKETRTEERIRYEELAGMMKRGMLVSARVVTGPEEGMLKSTKRRMMMTATPNREWR